MPELTTICITLPGDRGQCWVFIDPPIAAHWLNQEFPSIDEAEYYASGMSLTMGWPIENAVDRPAEPDHHIAFDSRQAQINGLLWLMTTVVHEKRINWNEPDFLAHAARQMAEIFVDTGDAMAVADRAVLIALGGSMLARATAEMNLESVDDLLPAIMVVDET